MVKMLIESKETPEKLEQKNDAELASTNAILSITEKVTTVMTSARPKMLEKIVQSTEINSPPGIILTTKTAEVPGHKVNNEDECEVYVEIFRLIAQYTQNHLCATQPSPSVEIDQ
ncbi:Protein of unknown function [Cotesia congregata]|uniref:Uncharacterized protein n=1 Tax=Cotesia congregata TaxID=51543 RepID=A0A8J2H5W4_COTCN|nr:Protein of unknown function [Cotesia congregata]